MTRIIHPVARTVHLAAIGAVVQFDEPSRMWLGSQIWHTAFRFTVTTKDGDRDYWGRAFADGAVELRSRRAGSTHSYAAPDSAKRDWREALAREAKDLIGEARSIWRHAALGGGGNRAVADRTVREFYRAQREQPAAPEPTPEPQPAPEPAHYGVTNRLLRGDPLNPTSGDLIAQTALLDVGQPVPEGWRVLSGNERRSEIARVVLRYELED